MTARSALLVGAWLGSMASIVAMVVYTQQAESSGGSDGSISAFTVALATLTAITTSTGWLLVARRPGNRVGLLLATGATLLAWGFLGFGVAAARAISHGQLDVPGGIAAVIGQASILPAIYLTVPLATMLFPDGRLPSPAWRWPARATAAAVASGVAGALVSPWPPADGLPVHPMPLLPGAVAEVTMGLSSVGLIAALALAVLAIVVRYRRAVGPERAQVKWLLAGLSVAAILFPISWTTDLGPDEGVLVDVLSVMALALVPLAILVAILRYRLYDIDRLVSRTLSWAIVSGVLIAGFAVLVVGLQTVLTDVTQGSTLAVAASTLVAFASFQPLRRRVQAMVDRRFDRAHYDATRTAARFAEQVRDEVDLERLIDAFVASAGQAVRPERAGVWLPPRSRA